jgi:nitrite reductase/ring-hydroxylating ferredoxin subunit
VLSAFSYHIEANMAEIVVGALADFPDGRGTPVQVGNRRLAIFRLGQRIFAVDDRCPHRGFPLHDGAISESTVRCRTHGSCFDLASGEVLRGPATKATRAYRARGENGQVVVELPD